MNRPVEAGHTWDTAHTVSLDSKKGKKMPRKTRRQMIKGGQAEEEYDPTKSKKRKGNKSKPRKRR